MAKITTKNVALAIYAASKNKSGAELTHVLESAMDFLKKKNLLSKAPEILKQLEFISDTEQGVIRAKVLSKKPLTKAATEQLESLLKKRHKAKSSVLEWQEDKTLIGGMRIETADEIMDLSLKNKVDQLQKYLLTT